MPNDFRIVKLLLVCFVAALPEGATVGQDAPDLRIMSFNIRFGTARDKENHWDLRKQNVVATIADFAPDVVGTQETLPFQAEFLQTHLEDYQYFGRSRDVNGNGEQCGILFKRSRFDVLEQGHFWLSETPNVPGSQSWDSSLPRMASWLKLFDRQTETAFYFVNTHFDHRGTQARQQAALVINERVERFEQGIPVLLVGDFNTGPGSEPYKTLAEMFLDTFDRLHPQATESGTFSGFTGRTDGTRIDLIFARGNWKIISADIDRRQFDGRNPSDHYPVTSVLRVVGD